MKKFRQIMAWIGIIFLAGMYILTLVFALMNNELADTLFRACVACTILVPVVLYACILVGRLSKKDEKKDSEKS
ncbi:MAG: hypothetical protein SOZ59_08310 [Candidatus Limivivens sp.]|nr:hypothetical protein [Candidatus Limivivens sp.]